MDWFVKHGTGFAVLSHKPATCIFNNHGDAFLESVFRGKSMSNQATHLNVKNLCSRKLWELASTRAVDDDQLRAVARELQLRRHYLQELETLQPKRTHH
jgi:hypothetical protein